MKKKVLFQVLFFLFVLIIYLFIAGKANWQFKKSNFPYFNYLADSLLQQKWDLVNPPASRYDLSQYQGRVYLYWGPLPAITIIPLIFIFGKNTSDFIYTACFGSLNALLLTFVLSKLNQLLKNKLSFVNIFLLTVFFAFGTVNFAVSVVGRVWFTSQVISLTVFLISLYFLLDYLFSKKNIKFILATCFLMTAGFGRLTYLLYLPMFVLSLFFTKPFNKKKVITNSFFLIFFIISFFALYGFYNYKRFQNPFETGYNFQAERNDFTKLRKNYGRYNIIYLVQNIKYQLINPLLFENKFPFIKPNLKGNGIFITSPLFLLLVFYIKKVLKNKYNILLISGVLPIFTQLMLFYGTGESQFGARYLLDLIPLLILILATFIETVSKKVFLPLFAVSVIISTLGAVWFSIYKQW